MHIIDTSCHHECGRIIEEVRVRGRLRVREVRVHGFATVRDSSSSSSSSSSLARAFFLARIFWTTLDGGKKKKKKKKKKKRSTTNFRGGWVGNREEEDDDDDEEDEKENENVPLDRRARVRKRRSKVVCLFGKNERKECLEKTKEKSAFFRAYFFLLRIDTKKKTTRALTSANNRTQTSLSLLSPSLLIQSYAESCCRSIRPVKTWTF